MGMISNSSDFFDSSNFLSCMKGIFREPDIKHVAIILGGIFSGNGDNIASLAMEGLPAGVAFPIYAGTMTVCSEIIMFLLEGSDKPLYLSLGLAGVLLGIAALGFTQKKLDERNISLHGLSIGDEEELLHNALLNSQSSFGSSVKRREPLSKTKCVLICLVTGIVASFWPPLAAFSMKKHNSDNYVSDPFAVLFLFTFGILLSSLTVIPITSFLSMNDEAVCEDPEAPGSSCCGPKHTNLWTATFREVRGLKNKQIGYCILTGFAISTGYAAYFSASVEVPSSVTFGLCGCAPLVALLIDICITDAFTGCSKTAKGWLCLCILSYGSALVLLSLAAQS